jgi:two-component system LytT family response regulator
MIPKICVLIIDSEAESLRHTKEMLQRNRMVSDVQCAVDTDDALLKIIYKSPDIVLLEYPMKGNAGEELIKFIHTKLTVTTIVYVSNSKDYAVNAIRNGVFNYVLKPLTRADLISIISKVQIFLQNNTQFQFNQIVANTQQETRLRVQTLRGYLLIDPEEILYCMTEKYCTKIYLTQNRTESSGLFLSKFEEILAPFNFLRISRWCLINQKYIRKVYRSESVVILSDNGNEYEVKGSKQQLKNLIDSE